MATAARRGIQMSKCLGLPPPLMYLHPQSLLSGSEPRMPHCFWKPPGKKGTEETPACPWHRKVPEVTPTCPGILYQHHPPWDCQVCYSPRACVKSPRCLKGLIGPSDRALLPRRQVGSTGQASWETLSGSSAHGTCIFILWACPVGNLGTFPPTSFWKSVIPAKM